MTVQARSAREGDASLDVLSGAACGSVGAMAMTGMRVITTELGLVEQIPPQAISQQRARGIRMLRRRAPHKQRRGMIEAAQRGLWPWRRCGFGRAATRDTSPSLDRTGIRPGGVVGLRTGDRTRPI